MLFHSAMADQPRMQTPEKSEKLERTNEEALKAEVRTILKNKKQCTYKPYECTQFTLDGYQYCLKHILQDKSAPYKQCSYVYPTVGKRCSQAAPKSDKKDYGYCNEHAMKTALTRNKQNSRFPPPQTSEVLLNSLTHYLKTPRKRTASSSTYQSDEGHSTSDENSEHKTARILDPYKDIDVNSVYNKACNDILDVCSESDSDVEAATYASIWHDQHLDSSDNESIDSEQEDLLKHADAYSAEEITSITRDKLIKLQSLYIQQYQYLQHLLKEKRRKYIHSLKREKETCSSIYNQSHENPKEQRLYKKLKALNNYHRPHGIEAILSKRVRDLKAKVNDVVMPKTGGHSKCIFSEGGVKCGEKTLPLARHCRKHILEDSNQVLFKKCGKMRADVECTTPIEAIFEDATCRLHMDVPPIKSYTQVRKNSESDFDDSLETNPGHSLDFETTLNEKSELDFKPELPRMSTLPSILFEESSDYFERKFRANKEEKVDKDNEESDEKSSKNKSEKDEMNPNEEINVVSDSVVEKLEEMFKD